MPGEGEPCRADLTIEETNNYRDIEEKQNDRRTIIDLAGMSVVLARLLGHAGNTVVL
jgi:hypothetical protein